MKKILILNDIHHGESRSSTVHIGEIRQANSQAIDQLTKYIDSINLNKYDLIVNLGDSIRDVGNKQLDKKLLRQVLLETSKIKSEHYFLPGNHELKSLLSSEIAEITTEFNIDSNLPKSIDLDDYQVLLIDLYLDEDGLAHVGKNTLSWLEKNINYDKNIIVMSHYSVVPIDQNGSFYFENNPEYMHYVESREILNIFNKCKRVIMINGHVHMSTIAKYEQITFISALSFSENIVAMKYPESNPGIYSELWIDKNKILFKSFSGKYCFLNFQL